MQTIEIKGAKEKLYLEHLDNGLDVYMLPNSKVKNFYLTLNVKFGSIYTDFKYKGKNYNLPKGVAHYLEHLMFNMPEGSAFTYFSKLGSDVNAFTSYDVTCYEVFANTYFKKNLEYLLKYVYTPYFTKELVNNERGIISEEIKMYEDNPETEMLYGLYNNMFINDEHQYLISGTLDDVKKIKLEDIENAYEAFYNPHNMFLIITGNFNVEESLAIINETMNNMTFKEYEKPIINIIKEPFRVKNEYTQKEMNVDNYKVSIGLKIPKDNFKSLKLSDLELKLYLNLFMRMNFGITSLLNENLQTNKIITDQISTALIESNDYFTEAIIASTDYPDYLIKKVKETISNNTILDDDIKRKAKTSISNLIMMFDDIELVNNEIQDDIIAYNHYYDNMYDYYNNLNSEIAKKFITKLNNYTMAISILKPQK